MKNNKFYPLSMVASASHSLQLPLQSWPLRHKPRLGQLLKSLAVLLLLTVLPLSSALFAQSKKPNITHECNTVTPPEAFAHEQQIANQLAKFTEEYLKHPNAEKAAIVVPIQLHIIRMNDGTGGINVATIRSEITNFVNTRYASIEVSFEECTSEEYINSTKYYNLSGDPEGDSMAVIYNVPNVLNMYFVNDPDGACGWARFPSLLPSDYVVIANSCADNTSTIAHEVGHYFDLYHTHETAFGVECVDGSNCGTTGDLLCDTPADPDLSGNVSAFPGCNYTGVGTDACNGDSYSPSTHNIMSYSQKQCRDIFTPQQNARILFTISTSRAYLAYGCSGFIVNDDCAFAEPLTCSSFVTSTTVGATVDGPPTDCNGNSVAPDVWYTIVGTGGNIRASLCTGTNYDSKLGIYTGSCGALSSVACDDDFCSALGPSQVTWASTLGTTYYIRVHGFAGATGNFSLSIACSAILTCPGNTTVAACQTQVQVNAAFNTWLASATVNNPCAEVIINNNTGAPSICGGSTTVTFLFQSDCNPLPVSCQATFTVTAAPAVTLTCPVNTTVSPCLTQAQVNTAYATWLASVSASGGCNGVLTNNSIGAPLICSPVAVVRTVVFTYTSTCAPLMTTCSATFTLPAYPDFTVPANGAATVNCPVNLVQPVPPVVLDACGKTATRTGPVIVNNPNPLVCEGTRTYTWTYSDCAGHSHPWSFVYTLVRLDFSVPPNGGSTVACPDQTDVQPVPPVVFSNCGELLTPVLTNVTPKPGCEGNRNYTWTYTDCAGHSHDWVYIYTVEYLDFSVPPSEVEGVECPLNATQPVPPVVYDNCGKLLTPMGPVTTSTTNAYACEGSRKYEWTYKDCEGNTHTWSKTFNFLYTADFFVYPSGEDFVACIGYAQAPIPPDIYDICGQLIKVTGPVITESLANSGCTGWRKFSYVYSDCGGHSHPWSFTYYINDDQAPLGTCPSGNGSAPNPVAVSVTNLTCVEEVPCPNDFDFTTKVEELLLAGNYFDLCSGNDLVVTMDSYSDVWDCSDPDGDGVYTFGRTFYFHIADHCGNEYPQLCEVTYSGLCQPIQAFSQKDWGNEGAMPGAGLGITDLSVIQNLLSSPIMIGGQNRSMELTQAQCIMDLLPATGGPARLRNCHQVNCTGCNPMVNGGLQNSLAGNMIALNLNLRYTSVYEGIGMDALMSQRLDCIAVHPCISNCEEGDCELRIFDGSGNEITYPYTLGGLMSLTNLYLDGALGLTPGFQIIYGTALNQSVGDANNYWSADGSSAITACTDGFKPVLGSDKALNQLVNTPDNGYLNYTLAPNPVGNEVTFTLRQQEATEAVTLEIYSGLGQLMLRKDFGQTDNISERIDLSGFNAGLYFVSVKAGEHRQEQKLVINK